MTSKSKSLGNGLENRIVEHALRFGLRAKKQPYSGALATDPSDVLLGTPGRGGLDTKGIELLCEAKVRSDGTLGASQSIRVEHAWLDKVRGQARAKQFAAGFLCVNPKGSRQPMVLLDLDDFLLLLQHI